ncbi:dTDP-4-dehydrorhamnose 3,5-epimerase [Ascidiaceihabitans sp.]|nr:dTDP-4-dehydrorhamnose 3,5-epimerase [Ascidiaceihabitans sp.]MDA9136023.1 dTDP-4-dehydrorhamnose 3,5-epimerase [Ascidiaceihabitans sp.]
MEVISTRIPDVKIIKPEVFQDERGLFFETWKESEFERLVTHKQTKFVQDNQSVSFKGVLRGLHYQAVNTQGKLVRVVEGEVFDVAVDVRRNSPTFGKWVGEFISAENRKMLWMPEGFAHGFLVVSDKATFIYKCTDYFNPEENVTIVWNDKFLNIQWPDAQNIIVSNRDKSGKTFKQCLSENILL